MARHPLVVACLLAFLTSPPLSAQTAEAPAAAPEAQPVPSTPDVTAPPAVSAPAVAGLPLLEGGVMELRVSRDHLVLGRDESAEVDIFTTDAQGKPVDVTGLVVLANVGTTEAPQHVELGHHRVTYRAPKVAFPHVALIAARATAPDGRVAGVVALPLWGQGRLNVETKAQSVVTLRVGDLTFGPVTANDAGVAVLEVTAPPGPPFGIAESLDLAGNETKQKVDLGVPAFNRIALFPLGETHAGGKVELLLIAVDRRGAMLDAGSFKLAVSRGTISEPRELRAGVWLLTVDAPPDVGNARLVVSAELEGERLSSVEAHLPLLPAPPARAQVRLAPSHHVAGSAVPVVVKVDVVDEHGNPVPTQGLALRTTLGKAEVQRHVGSGVMRGVWTPSDSFGGAAEAIVEVVDAEQRVLGSAVLTLAPGAAQKLLLSQPEPARRPGLPVGAYDVVATATDAHGNPVPSATLSFQSADGATLVSRQSLPDGSVRLTFVSPTSPSAGQASVTIRSDVGAAGQVAVPMQVVPQPSLRVAPKLAAQWNLGRLTLLGGGLDTTLLIPIPVQGAPVKLSVALTASTGLTATTPLSFSLTQPLTLRRLLFSVPALGLVGAEVQWRRLVLTGALGGGAHFAQARIVQPSQSPLALVGTFGIPGLFTTGEAVRLSAAGPALSGRLGAGVALGPGVLMTDVRLDAPIFLGTALTGFTGGIIWGVGYALQL
ncbi:MAG: Ig-like domain-containing protein [Myxococcota bacterium]